MCVRSGHGAIYRASKTLLFETVDHMHPAFPRDVELLNSHQTPGSQGHAGCLSLNDAGYLRTPYSMPPTEQLASFHGKPRDNLS